MRPDLYPNSDEEGHLTSLHRLGVLAFLVLAFLALAVACGAAATPPAAAGPGAAVTYMVGKVVVK